MRITMIENRTTAQLDVSDMITPDMNRIQKAFQEAGFELRIVGGAVRDLVLGKTPKDIDFATNATPNEMKEIFEKNGFSWIPTGEQHGTLTVLGPKDREPFEITTLRIDKETDGRHATVEYTRSWEQDAERRDLTYNAMSMDFDGTVYDYHGGLSDLRNDRTQFVGSAQDRIEEDYLRILRLFRFAGRYNHQIKEETLDAISQTSSGLQRIAGERIWSELSRILSGPSEGLEGILKAMVETGVLKNIGIRSPNINAALQARRNTDNPVAVLAAMVQTHDVFEKLVEKWGMSNQEEKLGIFILDHLHSILSQAEAQDLLVDGIDPEYIDELYSAQGKPNPVKNWVVPKFPVTGKDLIALGHKPGPEMGRTLKKLRNRWKESRFQLDAEELLGLNNEQNNTIQQ